MKEDGSLSEPKRGQQQPPPETSTAQPESQTPQLDRSRALNSEGLEGLVPRASLLLQTGAMFVTGFFPLIGLTIALFVGMYFVCSPSPSSLLSLVFSYVTCAVKQLSMLPLFLPPLFLLVSELNVQLQQCCLHL
jgi:hypothetical protein